MMGPLSKIRMNTIGGNGGGKTAALDASRPAGFYQVLTGAGNYFAAYWDGSRWLNWTQEHILGEVPRAVIGPVQNPALQTKPPLRK